MVYRFISQYMITTCNSHIKQIQIKLSRSISVLAKAKHFFNSKSLLIYSLFLPYLNYCGLEEHLHKFTSLCKREQ